MKPETELVEIIRLLDALVERVRLLSYIICPHKTYTTQRDPTAHQCDVCGVYLETDDPDGTGTVLVPHRAWTGKGEIT